MKYLLFLPCLLTLPWIFAKEIVVRSQEGQLMVKEVPQEERFVETLQRLQTDCGQNQDFILDFKSSCLNSKQQAIAKNAPRNFSKTLSKEDVKNISYIVKMLGTASLVKIAKSASSLKKAGKRINHIHPLQFLSCVFTDETLKMALHAMKSRGWVWGDFFEGLKGSLEEEAGRENLTKEQLHHFASQVNICPDLILPSAEKRQWETFLDTLFIHLPRSGEPDRYINL